MLILLFKAYSTPSAPFLTSLLDLLECLVFKVCGISKASQIDRVSGFLLFVTISKIKQAGAELGQAQP